MYPKNSWGISYTILLGDQNINKNNNCIEAIIVKLVVAKLRATFFGPRKLRSFWPRFDKRNECTSGNCMINAPLATIAKVPSKFPKLFACRRTYDKS